MRQTIAHSPRVAHFSFDSVDVTALTWGDPRDPILIALHGFPDSAWTWEALAPVLAAEGRFVVAPFLRGYAPSSLARDDDYSFASLVGDVLDVYRAVGADNRTVLVGHDWGGAIVSATSSCHPELFARTVLIAIPPLAAVVGLFTRRGPLRPRVTALARQLPRSWYMAVVSIPWLPERIGAALPRLLWQLWAPEGGVDAYRRRGVAALATCDRRRAAYSYYRAVWNPWYRRARGFRGRQRLALRAMRNPTLYLQGRDDTCGLERTGAQALDFLPPGSARIVVERAGHFAHLDRPDVIARRILEFIRSGEKV
ncbi:alpha/beta fold hydrolase [Nocardia transvalensis]|uniref:alpha/beta fold hydrolase n=1 Tax=Nocardia transvalensis TaxID=37333 RepID=UPI00189592DC|nr:alpha/beta fold hydrolase [Nocardia transvalensis]MBF6333110.1 alpha/beta fold hydrolase [Nocardia transvalensis]